MKAQWKALIRDTFVKELRSKTLIFIFIATTLAILLANGLLKAFMFNAVGTPNILINGSNILSIMFSFINYLYSSLY